MNEQIKIGSIIKQIRGVSYKPTDVREADEENAVALLRANNIQETGLNFDDLVYIDRSIVKSEQYLRAGDILICSSSGSKNLVGKAAYIPEDLLCSFGAFCKVVRTQTVDSYYLGQYFQSPRYRQEISEASAGANINNIRNEHIDELTIPLHSKSEQMEIVQSLLCVNKQIDYTKQQLAKLDELVKSRFIELFGGEKYEKKPIRELVDRKIASARKTYGSDETIHYIDISSIDNKGNVVAGTTEYIMADAPSRAQQCIEYGDILISTVRPNLRNIARNTYTGDGYVASSGFCVLRAKNCDARFLLCAVLADSFTNAMTEVTTGANYPAIKDSDVLEYRVPVPPMELQEQFATFVEQADKSKLAVKQSLEKLETLKKSLMQQYFG